jgi:uncharacterized protein (DUF342 family)
VPPHQAVPPTEFRSLRRWVIVATIWAVAASAVALVALISGRNDASSRVAVDTRLTKLERTLDKRLSRIERRLDKQKDDITAVKGELDATGGQAATEKDAADRSATDAAAAREAVKKLSEQVAKSK